MGLHSQRILVEAAYNGVIRREESSLRRIPHSSLPVPKFAANVVPCSAPLRKGKKYREIDLRIWGSQVTPRQYAQL